MLSFSAAEKQTFHLPRPMTAAGYWSAWKMPRNLLTIPDRWRLLSGFDRAPCLQALSSPLTLQWTVQSRGVKFPIECCHQKSPFAGRRVLPIGIYMLGLFKRQAGPRLDDSLGRFKGKSVTSRRPLDDATAQADNVIDALLV